MSRAEERALEAYNDMFHNPEKMSVRSTISPEEVAESNFDYKEPFKAFFLDVYQQGYEQAEKDLGLHPSTEYPPVDEKVRIIIVKED